MKQRISPPRTKYYVATTTIKISRVLKKHIAKRALPEESIDQTLRRLLTFSEVEKEPA